MTIREVVLAGTLFFAPVFAQDTPKVVDDPDIQQWYKDCGQTPGCKMVSRNVKVLDGKEWSSNPILIIRTSAVIDVSVARFKSPKGTIYIVMLIPDSTVDTALIRVLQGK